MCETCGCGETQPIGEVTHYYGKPMVAVIRADGVIKNGDSVRIKGGTTDFTMTVQGMRNEQEQEIESAHSGELIAFRTPEIARPGDKLYRP
jgi:translation elongation factor EF-1alpha